MSDFKAKMHQIRCRLGLCPRPRWGRLQRSPRPLLDFRGPTSKERGEKGRGRKGRWGEGRGGREGRGREGREGKWTPPNFYLDRRLWVRTQPLMCTNACFSSSQHFLCCNSAMNTHTHAFYICWTSLFITSKIHKTINTSLTLRSVSETFI